MRKRDQAQRSVSSNLVGDEGKLRKGTKQCKPRLRTHQAGESCLSEAPRQEKLEGSAALLASLCGSGLQTKINLGDFKGQREGKKQTGRVSVLSFFLSVFRP